MVRIKTTVTKSAASSSTALWPPRIRTTISESRAAAVASGLVPAPIGVQLLVPELIRPILARGGGDTSESATQVPGNPPKAISPATHGSTLGIQSAPPRVEALTSDSDRSSNESISRSGLCRSRAPRDNEVTVKAASLRTAVPSASTASTTIADSSPPTLRGLEDVSLGDASHRFCEQVNNTSDLPHTELASRHEPSSGESTVWRRSSAISNGVRSRFLSNYGGVVQLVNFRDTTAVAKALAPSAVHSQTCIEQIRMRNSVPNSSSWHSLQVHQQPGATGTGRRPQELREHARQLLEAMRPHREALSDLVRSSPPKHTRRRHAQTPSSEGLPDGVDPEVWTQLSPRSRAWAMESSLPVDASHTVPIEASSSVDDLWTDAQRGTCIVCSDAPAEATFVHGDTGHTACCLDCARELRRRGQGCPVCRQSFSLVIRNFVN